MRTNKNEAFKFHKAAGGKGECTDIQIFNVIYRTMVKLLDVSSDSEMFQEIGRALQELSGNALVLVFSANPVSDRIRTRAVLGESKYITVLQRLVENEQDGISLFLDDQLKQELANSRPVQIPGGLFDITGPTIPRVLCTLIEKELNITHLYAVGFSDKGRLSGGAVILFRAGLSDIDLFTIENFAKHISIAIQRRTIDNNPAKAVHKYSDTADRKDTGRTIFDAGADMLLDDQLSQKNKETSIPGTTPYEYDTWLESVLDKRNCDLESVNRKLLEEIDEKKKEITDLRTTLEEMENLLALAPVIIARADLKMNVQYVNKKFEEVTGYSAEEVVGKYWPSMGGFTIKDTKTMMKRAVQKLMGKPSRPLMVKLKRKDGKWIYVSGIGELVREHGRPAGFQAIGQDVTDRIEAEKEAKRSTARLQKALEGIIQAMAATVEMRDPYTAGHQRRVATLAREIAREIGLLKDQIIGIELAGLIHDLGKIKIPTEILTYPDVLSEAEFNIIKTHPAAGYDILKNIDFPWPVAGMVLQHHERMNGTGYPYGIKGDEIIIGARIIAVADVVEAIASHRPYRQALGIDRALKEIADNKGILYDPEIVDTCLTLFRKKHFEFSKE
jgi:PAS domain S-box-containing protein